MAEANAALFAINYTPQAGLSSLKYNPLKEMPRRC